MAGDDGARPAERVHRDGDIRRARHRVVRAVRTIRVAVTALVDRDDRQAGESRYDEIPEPAL
jgi:hypothetical protein